MGILSREEQESDHSLDQSQFFHYVDTISHSVIKEPNGDKYIGELKDNQKHGRGILIYANHEIFNKYEGFWKFNKKHSNGKSTMYYKDGTTYIGQWKNDMRDGEGILYYSTGEKFMGHFKEDKKEGKGYFYSKNYNSIFLGNYKNDVKDGKGITYYKKMNKISKEIWDKGVIISCEIEKLKNNMIYHINTNIKNDLNNELNEKEKEFDLFFMKKRDSKKINSLSESRYNKTNIPNNFFVIMNLVIMTYTLLYENGDINDWNEKTIIKLLEKIGIEKNKYNDIILNNQINGEKFLNLTDTDIKELKITDIKDSKIILKAVNFLQSFYKRYFDYYMEYQKEEEKEEEGEVPKEHIKPLYSMQKLAINSVKKVINHKILPFNEVKEESNESLSKINILTEEDIKENKENDSIKSEGVNEQKEKDNFRKSSIFLDLGKLIKGKSKDKQKYKKIIENVGFTLTKLTITNLFIRSLFQNGFDFYIPFDEIEKEEEIEQDDMCFQLFMGKWQGKQIVIKCLSVDRIKNEILKNKKFSKLSIGSIMQNYIKEINICNNLRHPNIILFIGVSINKNDFYIIFEYLENHSLYEILHKNKITKKLLKSSEKDDNNDINKTETKKEEIPGNDKDKEEHMNQENLNISINNINMNDNDNTEKEDNEEEIITPRNITPYDKFHLMDEITQKKILFQIAYEISVALRYIHSRNIIHCNLTTKYLFLDEEYHVKLGNFFYSKILNFFCDENKEEEYFMENKYEWTPPEILTNGKFVEGSDVYRLGLILYEIFTGEIPHKSAGSNQIIGLNYIVSENDIKSRYLVNLIQKCVSENPKDRPNLEYISNFLYKYSKFYDKRDFSFEEFGNFILA